MDTSKYEPIRAWRQAGFKLDLWDTNTRDGAGRSRLAYRLRDGGTVIFEGSDYGCAPSHAIDSDSAVEGILSFLSLGKGDTDPEYFADYTAEQIAWRDSDRRDQLAIIVFVLAEKIARANRRKRRR